MIGYCQRCGEDRFDYCRSLIYKRVRKDNEWRVSRANALCQRCFAQLSPPERIPYYWMALQKCWETIDNPDETWELIKRAVLSEEYGMRQM